MLIQKVMAHANVAWEEVEVFPITNIPNEGAYVAFREAFCMVQEVLALHGTRAENAVEIARSHLDPSKVGTRR